VARDKHSSLYIVKAVKLFKSLIKRPNKLERLAQASLTSMGKYLDKARSLL
jgi:hypothetical protein